MKCPTCKEDKSTSLFYPAKERFSGYRSRCKECERIDYRKRRKRSRTVFVEKDKRYYKKHKNRLLEKRKRMNALHRFESSARSKLRYAVKIGNIIKPNKCSSCDTVTAFLEAHHDDYRKPLDIRWLCRYCHRYHHQGK